MYILHAQRLTFIKYENNKLIEKISLLKKKELVSSYILIYSSNNKKSETEPYILSVINSINLSAEDYKIIEYIFLTKENDEILLLKIFLNSGESIDLPMIWNFMGSSYLDELNYVNREKKSESEYLKDIYSYCINITGFLKEINIDKNNTMTPSSVMKSIFSKFVKNPEIALIRFDQACYNIDQVCYKYFLLIKTFYKFNLPPGAYKKYNYIIKKELLTNETMIKKFYLDIKEYSLTELSKKTQSSLKKDYKKFFEGILSYINLNYTWSYHDNEDIFFKNVLIGGRVEIYKNTNSKTNVFCWDLPSAYFNMLDRGYPTGFIDSYTNNENNVEDIIDHYIYLCEVEWMSESKLPVLPVRDITSIYYPCGIFYGEWWGEELNYFKLKGGKIRKIIKVTRFTEFENIYSPFKQYFEKKIAINDNINKYTKRLKTAFFGNLSQKSRNIIETSCVMGNNKKEEKTYKSNPSTNFAVSSLITARCRITIHQFVSSITDFGLDVLATNIDCVYVTGDKELITLYKEKHPEYSYIWTGREKIFFDSLFVSSRHVFLKKREEERYYYSLDGLTHPENKILQLKNEFINTRNKSTNLNGVCINFLSYKNRIWEDSLPKLKTYPHRFNMCYPLM